MEQKFTFKRFLSIFVVCAMLLSSFAAFAVTAGAVDIYWAEGDYTIADGGNMTAANAYGYVFDIAGVNVAPNETNTIFTSDETWKTTNGWAVSVVLNPVEGDVYEVVTVYNAPQSTGDWKAHVDALTEGQIVMMAHSSGSRPNAAGDYNAEVEYANWQDKVAAIALKAGDKITLAGVDLEAGTATEATATVQDAPIEMTVDGDLSEWADNWTEVNAENGYWQNLPADENADAPYKFQMYDDGETLYVAAELSVVESTGLRIWFRTNDEATVYTSFYDIKADSVVGKYNQSLTANNGAVIEDSTAAGAYVVGEESITVEFAVTFEELGAVDGAFDYYINTFDGVGTLYYPPVVEGEGGNRLANLPYNNWYVEPTPDPEPEVPTENKNVAFGKNYDVTSGNGKESYAQYTANLTDGNIAEAISYDGNWFTFYNNAGFPDDINVTDGVGTVVVDLGGSYNITDLKVYTIDVDGASGIKVIKSIKAYVSEDGETWSDAIVLDIPTGILNATFAATAEVDLVANFVKFDVETDGIFGFINEIEVYADVPIEEEPTPDPELPTDLDIKVSHVNLYNWGTFESMIISGDGKTVVDVINQKPEWWIVYTVENIDGKYVATSYLKNSPDCYAVKVPEGGFLFYTFSANSAYAIADEGALLNYVFVLNGLDVSAGTTMAIDTTVDEPKIIKAYAPGTEPTPEPEPELPEGAIALDYAGYVHDSYFEILAADNKTVADLTTLGIGEAKDMNYFYVAVVGADNVITEMYTTLGRPDGVKSDVVCPEGGYIIGLNANKAGADALLAAKVGDSIVLYNVDVESFRGAEGSIALENAGFAIVPATEPEPVIPGLPENITVWGTGAGVEVMTDGYTGVDEINTWEGNTDKLYGFSNSVLDAAEYSFDITIEETTFDAVTLYVLDFVNGGVTLPDAVSFVINDVWYEATINGNENNIGTIVVELDEAVTASEITVVVSMGVSPHTFAIFNMFTEIEVNEVEVIPEPVIPGLPENITVWGSGAGVEVMTDGYTGVDEINTWEGNTDKLYGFSNSVLDAAEYSFDITIEETTFDAVTLYVLDFVNGGVTLPDAVSFVINDVWYEATINGNENNIGTIVVELDEAVTASEITVVVSMGVSPHTFAIFNMFTEIEVNEYVPVTSKVVTDFNPTGYKASYGGATGAFIYDDADIYAACGNDWWIHVAFAPVADMDGYYEVVAVRAPTTGNYLTIPENGFVWMAWSSAGDTPESAGAYALAFMNELKVGDIVNFVGVDFANHTTETDAYAEVWVDPNAPVNVALGKDYTLSGAEDATYNANLTDGNAYAGMAYDNRWFVFNAPNTVEGIGTAIIDLAGDYVISGVAVNLINETTSGVAKPEYVKFYVSADNETWTDLGEVALQDVQSAAYWTGIEDLEVTARYVKLEMKIGNPFSFLNEIEVYGKAVPAKVELVEGENEITVPALNSAIANTNFDKDLVITIAGQWNVTVVVNGVEYWPNRMGNLEAPLPAGENTVEFKNSAEEDSAIVAVLAAPIVGDTMDDPIALDKDGDYTADVTDKYPEGVYYQYTATEDGTVTITINSEAGWLYVINNVTAGKYGDMHWSDDEEVVASETIDVTAGDVIMIQVATYDPDNPWTAPIGTVDFTLDVPGESAPATVEIALGDVNMDGEIDQYDYILIKRHYFNTIVLNEGQLLAADTNGDGEINQYDYILVKRHYFETFVIEGTVDVAVEFLPSEE